MLSETTEILSLALQIPEFVLHNNYLNCSINIRVCRIVSEKILLVDQRMVEPPYSASNKIESLQNFTSDNMFSSTSPTFTSISPMSKHELNCDLI